MANIDREIRELQTMTIGQLRQKHAELFGEPARTGNRTFLWRRIAWRIQELQDGGISERARRRAEELANDADLRIRPPKGAFDHREGDPGTTIVRPVPRKTSERLPMAGTLLTRIYRGKRIEAKVQTDGVEFEGKLYGSLSAVAKAVTGTQWNGYSFFGLGAKRGDE